MSLSAFLSRIEGRIRYCRTRYFARRPVRLRNQTPVISFTFDDFPISALYTGGAILQEHGLAGTYYASLGLMNTAGPVGPMFSEEDLSIVLERGHELGCHTFDHYHSWDTEPRAFEASILRNREMLNRLLPKASFSTFSYPRSIPRPKLKRVAERHFQGCRGGGYQPFNEKIADLNSLHALFLEQTHGDISKVKQIIDQNCQKRGWLIIATHDIAENPTRFGCTPAFFTEVVLHAVASGAEILPVASALKEIRGRNAI